MPEYKILITDGLDEHGQSILRASASVDEQKGLSEADLVKVIADYDGLIVRGQTRVTASVLEAAPRLKVVGRAGVGVDNIDLQAAKKHGVAVVNAPTSTTIAVAELAIGTAAGSRTRNPASDASMKQGGWLKKEFEGVELSGKTLGVIGYGRIGTEVGRRAAAFGMNVVVYDPNVSEDELVHGDAEPVSLQDLFAWSDFISLHLPLNVQTRDLIGRTEFSQMRAGVRIISTAPRGHYRRGGPAGCIEQGKGRRRRAGCLRKGAAWPDGAGLPSRRDRLTAHWRPDR